MPRAAFRLFGFPVQVRPGFVVFLLIVVFLYQGSLGLWAAGAIAGFTLVHELGHAFAARATGARAEISLDFMAGYASYVPSRALSRPERVGIAAAGALLQMALAVGILLAMSVNPLSFDDIGRSDATVAIWWAGVALAVFNLLPVVPLDGGTIVGTVIDAVVPGRGQQVMVWFSLALTGVGVVLVATNDSWRPFTFLVALLGILQLQQLAESRPVGAAGRAAGVVGAAGSDGATPSAQLAKAEERAWRTGAPGSVPPGGVLSPWFRAHQALGQGDRHTARHLLVDDLSRQQPERRAPEVWWPPDAATDEDLEALVALLDDPIPPGNRYSAQVLLRVLMRVGQHERAARYGAASFTRSPSSTTALLVARAVAAAGDEHVALQWLRAAAEAGAAPGEVLQVIDRSPELATLRRRPDVEAFRQLLGA